MRNNETWTAAEREKLARLWNSGMSAGAIALSGEFPGKTANAIIGQVSRIRLKGTDMRKLGAPKAKKKRAPRRYKPAQPKPPTPPVAPPPPPEVIVATDGTELLIGRALVDLERTDCRFIITPHMAPPTAHRYCAADASAFVDDYGNNCYCAYHQRLMRAGAH